MLISDWSSDVCSSDLVAGVRLPRRADFDVAIIGLSGIIAALILLLRGLMDKFWLILTSVPTEGWVGLLSALFGSLLTTVGVLLSNRANRQQLQLRLEHEERLTRERLLRDRLEELYVLVSHWINAMFADHARLTLVMRGHTDYNQYLDSIINTKDRKSVVEGKSMSERVDPGGRRTI